MALFQKATRSLVYLKLAICGVTGSGKTFGALLLARGLVAATGKRIAFIDTENDSASLYACPPGTEANPPKGTFDFDAVSIEPPYEADRFVEAIEEAVKADYGVAIIDSASHFWKGILKYKDQMDSRGGNSYTNWKEADRKFDPVIDAVLQSKIHLIFCMRSKMDYVLQENSKGKLEPKKMGLAPVMRDGIEYEFTTVFDLSGDNSAAASKDRSGLFPSDRIFKITEQTGVEFYNWLQTATPPENKSLAEPPKPEKSEEDRYKDAFALFAQLMAESGLTDQDRAALFWTTAADAIGAGADETQWTLDQLTEAWKARKKILKLVNDNLNSMPL